LISIIIPSFNSIKIEKTIKSLLDQNFEDKYEIIVVDSSDDGTDKIISKYPVKMYRQSKLGPAVARNFGIRKAKGSIIVFIDADCFAPENWLRTLLKSFSDKNVVGVGGTYKNANSGVISNFLQYEIEERHSKMVGKNIDFIGTFNCAYRKKVFDDIGFFNEKMKQGEDVEFSYRVSKKYKLVFNKNAFVYHYHVDTLVGFVRQKFQRGFWKVKLYSRDKRKMTGDSYTSKLFILQILATFLFLILVPFDIIVGLMVLVMIYLMNFRFFIFLWKKNKLMIPISLILIVVRNVVGIFGILFGFF
jgi:glycosyltransferase involved in cell wall biosynthesis